MVYTYQELVKKKQNGEILSWETITKEQLSKLFITEYVSTKMIAELYDVSYNKVRYKREKMDVKENSIARYDQLLIETLKNNPDLASALKKDILSETNIPTLAKALTHYLFRNGPIEDMHAKGQFSQSDMKVMNKYMVNRIAGLLRILIEENWIKIATLMEAYKNYGNNWDEVEYDTEEIDAYLKFYLERNKKE